MNIRPNRDEERSLPQGTDNPVLLAETLRNAATSSAGESSPAPAAAKTEERLSMFWRVFGGTVLSIVAMVAVTLYTQLSNGINDLRSTVTNLNTDLRKELTQVNQAQAEHVKKEEFSSRISTVWTSIKELQTLSAVVTALKERSLLLEQQDKLDAERREIFRKDLQEIESSVAVLKEKMLQRDQQEKDEAARKELVKELQRLRERLATMEGKQAANGAVKPAAFSE